VFELKLTEEEVETYLSHKKTLNTKAMEYVVKRQDHYQPDLEKIRDLVSFAVNGAAHAIASEPLGVLSNVTSANWNYPQKFSLFIGKSLISEGLFVDIGGASQFSLYLPTFQKYLWLSSELSDWDICCEIIDKLQSMQLL
jgi:hypothetical protein